MWRRAYLSRPSNREVRVGYSFQLSETGLSVADEAGFARIDLAGGHPSAEPGAPQIPFLLLRVAVPQGAAVPGVKLVRTGWERLAGRHVVVQAQQPGWAGEQVGLSLVGRDQQLYDRKGYYPATAAELVADRSFGPYRVVTVRVNPVQYRPAEGALWINRDFTVAVDWTKPPSRSARSKWGVPQLARWYDLVSMMVINPEDLVLPTEFRAPAAEAPYLIVTNREMCTAFERLATWKSATGLAARVVTMEDILNRFYGDFSVGAGGAARDTQEVLRNFLKWAHRAWRVCYLLIGGDTEVVPIRQVAALGDENWYPVTKAPRPEAYRCRYDPVRLQTNLYTKEPLAADTPLLAVSSGRRIPHNADGSATSLGWHWATSDSYAHASAVPTGYVAIRGPASLIDDSAGFFRVEAAHLLPTDLYYASLASPLYDKAGRHDWDHAQTGLFGYYNERGEPSGIDFVPDLSVGRAPCSTQAEASAVVDRMVGYERFEGEGGGRPCTPSGHGGWGGYCPVGTEQVPLHPGGAVRPLGAAFDARVQLLTIPGWQAHYKRVCLSLNLLGDPAVRPWLGVPQRLSVQAPLTSTIYSTIVIGVSDAAGTPIEGAQVCLYQSGKLMRTAHTGPNGAVLMEVTGAGKGALTVTATKPGWAPAQRVTQLV